MAENLSWLAYRCKLLAELTKQGFAGDTDRSAIDLAEGLTELRRYLQYEQPIPELEWDAISDEVIFLMKNTTGNGASPSGEI